MANFDPDVIGLLSEDVEEYLEVFRAAFIEVAEHTMLPELCEIFGDRVMAFLSIFGGRTFVVPDRNVVNKALQLVEVYTTLQKNPELRSTMAKKYNVPPAMIDTLYGRIAQRMGTA